MNFSHFGVDTQGALFSCIVRVRNIIRTYSKKLFCWFTAVCKSIVITSINNKFGIVCFFDQCSIFSDLFSHTIFTKISPFWDIKLYQFCQLKFKLFLQIGRKITCASPQNLTYIYKNLKTLPILSIEISVTVGRQNNIYVSSKPNLSQDICKDLYAPFTSRINLVCNLKPIYLLT